MADAASLLGDGRQYIPLLRQAAAQGIPICYDVAARARLSVAGPRLRRKTALLFGAEQEGVSDRAIEQSDACLQIPLYGFTESFNISVAVAVCLYNLTSRLHVAEVDWNLSELEKDELRTAWVRQALGEKL